MCILKKKGILKKKKKYLKNHRNISFDEQKKKRKNIQLKKGIIEMFVNDLWE